MTRGTAANPTRPFAPSSLWPGAVGAIVTVAVTITLGVFAFAPMGPAAAHLGVAASFATTVVSALVLALLARSSLPVAGPSSATALVYAGLMVRLLQDAPDALAHPGSNVLVPLGLSVVAMGLMQVAMASLGLARLVRFVPHSVLAGFMNGIAVLVLVSQLPVLLSAARPDGSAGLAPAASALVSGPMLLGFGVAALIWLLAWKAPRVPAALLAVTSGAAVYHLLVWLWPGAHLGPVMAGGDGHWPVMGLLAAFDSAGPGPDWPALLPDLLLSAAVMAVVGSLESILSLRALDQQLGERNGEGRELAALGWANVAGGLVGALPAALLRTRALAILQAGGRGRAAALGSVVASALLFALGGGLIGLLPQAVLAGAMLTIGVSLADRWSLRLIGRWLFERRDGPTPCAVRQSLAIGLVVCALTLWQGPAAGVVVGVLLSGVVFMQGMHRSLLRARTDGALRPSRRIYPPQVEQRLQPLRHRIAVFELEGALFFGSAERLIDEAESLPPDMRCLVLDFRRVGSIDESGALMLAQLRQRLALEGKALLLAHVGAHSDHAHRLDSFGVDKSAGHDLFDDADRAIEHGERLLLADEGDAPDDHRVPALDNALLQGLDAAAASFVLEHLRPVSLQAGATLFHQGDPPDGVYLVLRGSVSVVATAQEAKRRQRFVSLSPGTLFGEMAMLDGAGRTADAIADTDCELMQLGTEALQQIEAAHPEIAAALYRNMARYLAERLRVASLAWTAAAS
ncbi:MAG TPA: SulP family inorganic anion transporter [Burkholderiaceae bacterium]|nr:SulP family inorganic anion transporter [Burkholderiaceae bacterium]